MSKLSHLDDSNKPAMVDVSEKQATLRTAHARCYVEFPPEVSARLVDGDIQSARGPALATASIAGVMAANHTH